MKAFSSSLLWLIRWRTSSWKRIALCLLSSVFGFYSTSALAQGSLTPPGAPAPTMKTLQQIEPRTPISVLPFAITTSGSYYVTTNLTGLVGQSGITVGADEVTIDLSGFTLTGLSSGSGIQATGVIRKALCVRNGNLRGWSWGVNGEIAETCAAYDLKVSVSSNGIYFGANSLVRDCRVENQSGFIGITAGQNSTISGCGSFGNSAAGVGISIGSGSVIENCTAKNNFIGFSVGAGSTVRGCVAFFNNSSGFTTGDECTVVDSTADSNVGSGFILSHRTTATHCSASANDGDGFNGVNRVHIFNCTANNNGTGVSGRGFSFGDHGTIQGCLAHFNRVDGILVGGDALVLENHASENGQGSTASAGIRCTGTGNRVDSNQTRDNLGRGIWCSSALTNNLVIRNTSGNNALGNYLVTVGTAIGATNALGGTITDNNPWRNFSF